MKVRNLKLRNYRGIEEMSIHFHMESEVDNDNSADVSVIAGINGLGKSSILHGLRVLLSRSLPDLINIPFQEVDISEKDIRKGETTLELIAEVEFKSENLRLIFKKTHSAESDVRQTDLTILRRDLEFHETRSRLLLLDNRNVARLIDIVRNLEKRLLIENKSRNTYLGERASSKTNYSLDISLINRLREEGMSISRLFAFEDFNFEVSRIEAQLSRYSGDDQEELQDMASGLRYYLSPEDNADNIEEIDRRAKVIRGMIRDIEDELRKREFQIIDIDSEEVRVNKKEKMVNSPLVVYYSSNRQVSRELRSEAKSQTRGVRGAYRMALEDRPINSEELERWIKSEIYLNRVGVINKIINAIKSMSKIDKIGFLNGKQEDLIFWKSGTPLSLLELSDGEKILISLTFDLARRLVLANPNLSDPIENGFGIVIVDEIELHLHPSWQRVIVNRLQDTFKSCQFILTTHSPQIIGEVKKESITLLKIKNGKVISTRIKQSFGLDSNRILTEVLGVNSRNDTVEKEFAEIFKFIDDEDFTNAKDRMDKLRNEIGDDPEILHAQNMLDLLGGEVEKH